MRKGRKPKKRNDYSVGFGKPPPEHQWQKGVSGNPKGRPAGKKNKGRTFKEMMDELMTYETNNGTKKFTVREYLWKILAHKAFVEKDLRAIKTLMELDTKYAPGLYENGTTDERDQLIKTLQHELEESRAKEGGVLVVTGTLSEEEWIAKYADKTRYEIIGEENGPWRFDSPDALPQNED